MSASGVTLMFAVRPGSGIEPPDASVSGRAVSAAATAGRHAGSIRRPSEPALISRRTSSRRSTTD
jgi:hypothetical protein